jgi:hypothetical protein
VAFWIQPHSWGLKPPEGRKNVKLSVNQRSEFKLQLAVFNDLGNLKVELCTVLAEIGCFPNRFLTQVIREIGNPRVNPGPKKL